MDDHSDTVLHHQVREAVTGLTLIAERLAGYVERLVLLEERNNHAAIRLEEFKQQVNRETVDLKVLIATAIAEVKIAAEKDREQVAIIKTSNTKFQTIFSLVSATAVIVVPIVIMKWIGG